MKNKKGFKDVSTENDTDRSVVEKTITGKMTPLRYKLLHRFVRKQTYRTRCHHEWDCCGCIFKRVAKLNATIDSATITITYHYNV